MERLDQTIEDLIVNEQRFILDLVTCDYQYSKIDKRDFAKQVYPELNLNCEDDLEELDNEICVLQKSFSAYWFSLDDERKLKFIRWTTPNQQQLLGSLIKNMVLRKSLAQRIVSKVSLADEIVSIKGNQGSL